MTYKIKNDILYINFIQSKPELSQSSQKQYEITLRKFTTATQSTLQEIIDNCRNQQDKITETITSQKQDQNGNTIVEKTVTTFDVNNPESYIKLYLNTHIQYCKNKNNSNNTINHDLIYITTFLKHYHIRLPKIEKFKEDTKEWNLLTKEDINYILSDSTLTHKCLIKLLMSSGMRLSDALNLTWNDIINGTRDYHNFHDLYEFAKNAPSDMICTFEFEPQKTKRHNIQCITFCDQETMNLLLQNLNKLIDETIPRINKKKGLDLRLQKTDAVFGSQKQNFKKSATPKAISERFTIKNKKLHEYHITRINERIKNNELSVEDYEAEVEKIPRFHAHGLRKYFSSMVARNVGNIRICTILEGHTSPVATDSAYIDINFEDIREAYYSVIPDLSLKDTETRVYTSNVRREMEEKISTLEQENKQLKEEKDKEVNALWKELNNIRKRQNIWEEMKQ